METIKKVEWKMFIHSIHEKIMWETDSKYLLTIFLIQFSTNLTIWLNEEELEDLTNSGNYERANKIKNGYIKKIAKYH